MENTSRIVETLETRSLLTSASFSGSALTVTLLAGETVSVSATATVVTVTSGGQSVTINNGSGSPITLNPAIVQSLTMTGSSINDTIDLSGVNSSKFTTLTSVSVDAGDGDDTITGSSLADALTGGNGNDVVIGGSGNDTLNGSAGNDSLNGGDGNDNVLGGAGNDTLLMGNGQDTLNGQGGTDTVQGTNAANTWNLTSANSGNINTTSATTFSQVEQLIGGTGTDWFVCATGVTAAMVIDGGSGTGLDTLQGQDVPSTWSLGPTAIYSNASVTINFTGIETLQGGANADTFNVTSAMSGMVLLGGNGNDVFNLNAALTGATSTANGQGDDDTINVTVAGVVNLLGGSGNDTFVIDAPVTGSINGNSGIDTLRGLQIDSVILTASDANGFDGTETSVSANFLDVESIIGNSGTLAGQNSANTWGLSGTPTYTTSGFSLNFSGFSTLQGGTLVDTFNVTLASTFNLKGGTGDDVINLSATLTGAVDGEGGTETLKGANSTNTWNLTGDKSGNINGTSATVFSRIEKLIGGTSPDSFVFATAVASVDLDGGLGTDRLDYSLLTSAVTVNLGTSTATGTTSIKNIENVTGGSGNDLLTGDGYANLLDGGPSGNDTLKGVAGNDTLTGGVGNDSLVGGNGIDVLQEYLDVGSLTLTSLSLTGGLGTDALVTLERAVLSGGAGDNTFDASAFAGNVTLIGGAGNDTLTGGSSNDSLDGGAGTADWVQWSRSGNQTLSNSGWVSEAETDSFANFEIASLTGDAGANVIDATTYGGCVRLIGNDGNDLLLGSLGGGTLNGGAGNDSIFGGAGNEYLYGGGGTDTLNGGSGNDRVDGQSGSGDVLTGGLGDDTFAGDSGDVIVESSNTDFVLTDSSLSGLGNDSIVIGVTLAQLTGGTGANTLNASVFSGTVTLFGGDGDDTLMGGFGNDLLDGGTGTDRVTQARSGNQTLSNSSIVAVFGGVTQTDTLLSIESGVLTGDAGANLLDASAFAGLATLVGGLGDDTLAGSQDSSSLDGGDGVDELRQTITGSAILTNSPWSQNGVTRSFVAIERFLISGDVVRNLIDATTFTSGGLTLNGGAGDDTLIGSASGDFLNGGAGTDTVKQSIYGSSGATQTLTDTSLTGLGADTLTGIERAELTGGSGNDVINTNTYSGKTKLDGGGGADTLIGGPNNDVLIGGLGNDALNGGGGEDVLTDSDSAGSTLLGGDGMDLVNGIPDDGLRADVNGDGRQDVVWWAGNTWNVALFEGDRFQTTISTDTSAWSNTSTPNWQTLLVGDFNGDKLEDLLGLTTSGEWIAGVSDGSKFVRESWSSTTTQGLWTTSPSDWTDFTVGDFNGDGKDDVVARNRVNGDLQVARLVATDDAPSSAPKAKRELETKSWITSLSTSPFKSVAADVTGDGRDDLVQFDRTTDDVSVAISTGTSYFVQTWGANLLNTALAWKQFLVGDINGDQRQDITVLVDNQWITLTSTSSAFVAQAGVSAASSSYALARTEAVDVNRDGRTDLVTRTNVDEWQVHLATASGLTPYVAWTDGPSSTAGYFEAYMLGSGMPQIPVVDYFFQLDTALRTYDDVHNSIEFEPYRGVMKGPDATRETQSGNSWDQTSLLLQELGGTRHELSMTGTPSSGTFSLTLVRDKTFLSEQLSTSDTGIDVVGASELLGTALPFVIRIDNEQMQVTGISGTSGNTLTVTRGFNGTNTVGHENGAVVSVTKTTTSLSPTITNAELQTVLDNIDDMSSGDVTVTGGPLASAPFVISYRDRQAARLTIATNSLVGATLSTRELPLIRSQYAFGDVVISSTGFEQLQNWLGVKTTKAAVNVLEKAGLLVDDNSTESPSNIVYRHAWAQVWLPGVNGLGWQTLDPSWKQHHFQQGGDDLIDQVPFDEIAFESLGVTKADLLPVQYYEDQLQAHLKQAFLAAPDSVPMMSLEQIPYTGPIIYGATPTLPEHAPWSNFGTTTSVFNLADSVVRQELHRFRVVVLSSPALVSVVLPVADYSLARIELSYAGPASGTGTQTLHFATSHNEDLMSPLSRSVSTNLKNDIRIDHLSPGTIENVLGPALTTYTRQDSYFDRAVTDTIALGLSANQMSAQQLQRLRDAITSGYATNDITVAPDTNKSIIHATAASLAAAYYTQEERYYDAIVAGMTEAVSVKAQVGSQLVTVTQGIDLTSASLPYGYSPTATTIDVGYRAYAPVPLDSKGVSFSLWHQKERLDLASRNASALEHHSLQSAFGREAVSATKVLQKARTTSSNPIYTFVKLASAQGELDINSTLPRYGDDANHPTVTKSFRDITYGQIGGLENGTTYDPIGDQIINYLEAGFSVEFPWSPVTVGGWTGYAMIASKFTSTTYEHTTYICSNSNVMTRGGDAYGGLSSNPELPTANTSPVLTTNLGQVNLVSGNVFRDEVDVKLPNYGVPIEFARHYESQNPVDIGMGKGWQFTFGDQIRRPGGGGSAFIWQTSSGQQYEFTSANLASGIWTSPNALPGVAMTTVGIGTVTPEYWIKLTDGTVYIFDAIQHGQYEIYWLKAIRDRAGNQLDMEYVSSTVAPKRRLISVKETQAGLQSSIERMTVGWSDNHISSVSDVAGGRTWSYSYKAESAVFSGGATGVRYLESVERPTVVSNEPLSDRQIVYAYAKNQFDGIIRYAGLDSVTEPGNRVWKYGYDHRDRVVAVTDPDGQTTRYEFDAVRLEAKVIDPNGITTLHQFDEYGRSIRETESDRSRIKRVWNDSLSGGELADPTQVTSEEDVFGFVTSYGYDDNGNQSSVRRKDVVVNLGASFEIVDLLTERDFDLYTVGLGLSSQRFFQLASEKLTKVLPNNTTGIEIRSTTFKYQNENPNNGTEWSPGFLGNPTVVTETGYVANGSPTTQSTSYVYDNAGHVKKVTAPNGLITSHEVSFNSTYKTVQTWKVTTEGPALLTATTIHSYDVRGNLDSVQVLTGVDSSNTPTYSTTSFDQDVLNRVIVQRLVNPLNATSAWDAVTTYKYDAAGNLVEMVDPRGNLTKNRWTTRNQLSSVTGANGGEVRYEYDAAGNLVSTTEPLGHSTQFVYDARNRIVQTLMADGSSSFTDYDGASRPVAVTAANGAVSKTYYDQRGLTMATVNALGQTTTFGYDVAGNLTRLKNAMGNVADFKYDGFNRQIQARQFKGDPEVSSPPAVLLSAETTDYSSASSGQVASTKYLLPIDANGSTNLSGLSASSKIVTITTTDPLGRVIAVKDAMDKTTSFGYDVAGRLLTVTDPLGRVTRNTYFTQSGWLQSTQHEALPPYGPLPAGWTPTVLAKTDYTYNAVGEVLVATAHVNLSDDAATKQTTEFKYDELNRPVVVKDAKNQTSETLYDVLGRVVSQVNALKQSGITLYDVLGRRIQETLPDPDGAGTQAAPVLRFAYDVVGNLTAATDALRRVTTSTYDLLNRVVSTAQPDPDGTGALRAPLTNYTYDAVGNRTLVEQTVVGTGTLPVQQTGYVYDALNRVTSVFVPDPTVATGTANFGRVWINGVMSGLETKTGYDSLGRVTTTTDALSRMTLFAYDKMNRLTMKTQPAPMSGQSVLVTGYTYDGVGNLKTVTDPTGSVTTYDYDDLNRQKKLILPGVTTYRNGEPKPDDPTTTADNPTTIFEYDMVGNLVKTTDPLGHVSRTEYDKLNRKIRDFAPDPLAGTLGIAVGANVIVATYAYDEVGNLKDAGTGDVIGTDELGQPILARHSTQRFDALNRRISVTLPNPVRGAASGPTTTFQYDVVGNLVTTTDALGRESSTEYDALNRAVSHILPDPSKSPGDALYGKTRDATGSLRNGSNVLYGTASTTVYDEFGNVASVTDRLGRTTKFGFDVLNRKIEERLPDPTADNVWAVATTWGYDRVGNVKTVTVIDPMGNRVTNYDYDALNRLRVTYLPDATTGAAATASTGLKIAVNYIDATNTKTVTDQLGRVTKYELDPLGRVTAVVLPHATSTSSSAAGPRTEIFFDAAGNETLRRQKGSTTDSVATPATTLSDTVTIYDARNRQTLVALPDAESGAVTYANGLPTGLTTTWGYDAVGNVISMTDTAGRKTTSEYDQLDRLKATLLPNPTPMLTNYPDNDAGRPRTDYLYDEVGNLIETIDARLSHTATVYDVWNRPTAVYLPDPMTGAVSSTHSQTTYDLVGNVLTTSTPQHVDAVTGAMTYSVTSYEYDNRNRQIVVVLPNSATGAASGLRTEYRYDTVGNRIEVRVGETAGTPLDDANARVTKYEYDKLDRQIAVVLPDKDSGVATGLRTEYRYDEVGNQKQIRVEETTASLDSIIARVTDFSYDRLNRVTDVYLPNPETLNPTIRPHSQMTYDDLGNVLTEKVFLAALNSVAGINEVDRTTRYDYDRLNRNKAVFLPDAASGTPVTTPSLTYHYDNAGLVDSITTAQDVVSNTVVFGVTTFTYDRLNRKLSETLPNPANGSATGGPKTQWQYDAVGNITLVTDPRNAQTAFVYDMRNRQIAVVQADASSGSATGTVTGLRTEFVFDEAGNQIEVHAGVSGSDPGRITNVTYDFLNRPTDVYLPRPGAGPDTGTSSRLHTQTTYDLFGNVSTQKVFLGGIDGAADRTTTYIYDKLNRQTAVILPKASSGSSMSGTTVVGDTTSYAYDLFGNVESVTDARGGTTKYTYDRLSRKRFEDSPNPMSPNSATGPQTQWKFDLAGNVIEVMAPFDGTLTSSTKFEFDARNRQTAMVEPNKTTGAATGLRTEFTYDLAGNRQTVAVGTSATDTDKRITDYDYDFLNRVTDVYSPKPGVEPDIGTSGPPHTHSEYDANGNLTKQTEFLQNDTVGRSTSYVYDKLNRATTERLPNSVSGLDVDSSSNALGMWTEFGFDVFGNVITETTHGQGASGLTRVTARTYDRLNHQLSEQLPSPDGLIDGPLTYWQYDLVGNVIHETGPLESETKTVFDARNQTSQIFWPDKDTGLPSATASMTYGYDESGNLISQVDAANRHTEFKYDALNRQTDRIDPRPSDGLATSGTTILGLLTHTLYDAAGNARFVFDPVNIQGINVDALVIGSMDDATKRKATETVFDLLNRAHIVTQPDPDGAGSQLAPQTTYEYDAYGNLDLEIVRLTATTSLTTNNDYDRLNRKVKVTDPNPAPNTGVTEYGYDFAGNTVTIKDADNNTTTFTYDKRNRLLTETNSLNKTRTSTYDAQGRLQSLTDRNGRVREFQYDGLDRQIAELWKNGSSVVRTIATTFDLAGQVLTQSDPDSSLNYTYDLRGRLSTMSNAGTPGVSTVLLAYQYDTAGNVQSRTQTIGTRTVVDSYLYYATDWLKQQNQTGTDSASGWTVAAKRVEYTYNGLGQFATIVTSVVSSGTAKEVSTATYGYDVTHRLKDLVHTQTTVVAIPATTTTTTLAEYHYGYDAASRMNSEHRISRFSDSTTSDETFSYSHDDAGQLTVADLANSSNDESYGYDANGNRISSGYRVGDGVAGTPDNNRLERSPNGANQFTYTYDDEGNRLTRGSTSSADGSVAYQWDYRDRLTLVTIKDSTGTITKTVAYTYNTQDERISREVDIANSSADSVERYVTDGQTVLLTETTGVGPSNTVSHQFLHGPEVDQIFADDRSVGSLLWALCDLNGSVRDVTTYNVSTDVTTLTAGNHRAYDSFGVMTGTPTDAFAYGYTGREYDSETGLQYNRDRWYDARVGRFLSEDPIGFAAGDGNLNRYVFNDPLTNSDPSGNSWFSKLWKKTKNVVHDLGNFVDNIDDKLGDNVKDAKHWAEDQLQDTGHFFEEQWDNGNIQKALLAATALVSAGMATPLLLGAGAGLMSGGLAGAWVGFAGAGTASGVASAAGAFSAISTTISAASSAVNAYEAISGDQVGGADFSRILGGVAMVTGGINGGLRRGFDAATGRFGVTGGFQATPVNVIHASAGIAGGYEALSGRTIGDGTFTNALFGASSLTGAYTNFGSNEHGYFGPALQATAGGLSIAASVSGDRNLAEALRVAQFASNSWGLGGHQLATYTRNTWNSGNAPGGQYEPTETYMVNPGGAPVAEPDDVPLTWYDGAEADGLRRQENEDYLYQLQMESLTDFGSPNIVADQNGVGPGEYVYDTDPLNPFGSANTNLLSQLRSEERALIPEVPKQPLSGRGVLAQIFADGNSSKRPTSFGELLGRGTVSERSSSIKLPDDPLIAALLRAQLRHDSDARPPGTFRDERGRVVHAAVPYYRNWQIVGSMGTIGPKYDSERDLARTVQGLEKSWNTLETGWNETAFTAEAIWDHPDAAATGVGHGATIIADELAFNQIKSLHQHADQLIAQNANLGYNYSRIAAKTGRNLAIAAATGGISAQTQSMIAAGQTISGTRALVQTGLTVWEGAQTADSAVATYDAYQQGDWVGVGLNGLGVVGGTYGTYSSGKAAYLSQPYRLHVSTSTFGSGFGGLEGVELRRGPTLKRLSDPNPVPSPIREQYEEIILGNGVPRVDSNGAQKIFDAAEIRRISGSSRNVWQGSKEFDVPGTNHRILERPDGLLGYVLNHDYSKPRLFPRPWYPDGR